MDAFSTQFTDEILSAFETISRLEALCLRHTACLNLSIGELQILRRIDRAPHTVSELAGIMSVTTPSMTVEVQKLTDQGYVEKKRSEEDKRMVYVSLTEDGKRVANMFRFMHENMARSVSKLFTQEEKDSFLSGLAKLNEFLDSERKRMEDKE